jgi:hypothetical protein
LLVEWFKRKKCLLSKCEALSSNPSASKKKKKKRRKKRRQGKNEKQMGQIESK